jgi:hypothetical protein
MHMDNVPRSLAAAISIDLALSKSDGMTKLGEHLKKLLAPVDNVDEIPNVETRFRASLSSYGSAWVVTCPECRNEFHSHSYEQYSHRSA